MAFRGKRALIPGHSYAPQVSSDEDSSDSDDTEERPRIYTAPTPKFGGKGFHGKGASLGFQKQFQNNPNLFSEEESSEDDSDDDNDAEDGDTPVGETPATMAPDAPERSSGKAPLSPARVNLRRGAIGSKGMSLNLTASQSTPPPMSRKATTPTRPEAVPRSNAPTMKTAGLRQGAFPGKGAAILHQFKTVDKVSDDEEEEEVEVEQQKVVQRKPSQHMPRPAPLLPSQQPLTTLASSPLQVQQRQHGQQQQPHRPTQLAPLNNMSMTNMLQQAQSLNSLLQRQNSLLQQPSLLLNQSPLSPLSPLTAGVASENPLYKFNYSNIDTSLGQSLQGMQSQMAGSLGQLQGQGRLSLTSAQRQELAVQRVLEEKKKAGEANRLAKEKQAHEREEKELEKKRKRQREREENKRKKLEEKTKRLSMLKAKKEELKTRKEQQDHQSERNRTLEQERKSSQALQSGNAQQARQREAQMDPVQGRHRNAAHSPKAPEKKKTAGHSKPVKEPESTEPFTAEELAFGATLIAEVLPLFSKVNKLSSWMKDQEKTGDDVLNKVVTYLVKAGQFISSVAKEEPPTSAQRMRNICWAAASRALHHSQSGKELRETYSLLRRELKG